MFETTYSLKYNVFLSIKSHFKVQRFGIGYSSMGLSGRIIMDHFSI